MRHHAEVGQLRHQHHRGLADAEEDPLGRGIGDAPARPSRQVDRHVPAIAQSEKLQRRCFPVVADAGGDARGRIAPRSQRRSVAAPVLNTARVSKVPASSNAMLALPRLVTRICPSSATAPATPGNPGSVAMCLPGVVVDHLDAIARGVCNEDPPALRIEGGVIKLTARGARYGDGSGCFQRHDDLTALARAIHCAENNRSAENNWRIREKKTGPGFVHAQSPRTSSVAQSLDGDRLMGSLHVPSAIKLVRRERSRKTQIRSHARSMPARSATSRRAEAVSTPPCGTSHRRFFHRA